MDGLKLPQYVIPWDLIGVLDCELDVYSLSKRARVFSQVLDILKNVDYIDLSENHYLLLLKLGLYLEEYKKICDMKKNTMSRKKIEIKTAKRSRKGRLPKLISKIFHIRISENKENKVLIKVGDFVDLTANCKTCTLRVTKVTENLVKASDDEAKFYQTFNAQKTFEVAFRLNNYFIRCAHFTLWLLHERNSVTYLFPFKNKPFVRDDSTIHACDLKLINPALESNPEQKQAVSNIVNMSSFPVPYILDGPPGTGKTTTLIEAISQLHRIESTNILVCTPSNTAADEITKMLLKLIPLKDIYRIYNQYTDKLNTDGKIQKCANCENGKIILPKYLDVVSKRIIITTLCNCMRLILIGIDASYFSHVIIDDADQAIEPEILIPVSLVSENGKLHSQIVLAGDPHLRRLTVRSKKAKPILGRSILERLISYEIYQKNSDNKYNSKYITKLLQNYRIHPDILQISNKLFHNNELISKRERNANEKFPVIFYGVDGLEEKKPHTNNIHNMAEVDVVVDYVDDLLCNRIGVSGVTTDDIGIITPFAAQSKEIKNTLKSIGKLENIKIGTIDCFQDDERKVMIMSTVKSKTFVENGMQHIGILSNANFFNLAMTRATELLIVIGNPIILQIDDMWHHLIKFCLDNKSYDGIDFSLDGRDPKRDGNAARITALTSSRLFEDNLLKLFRLEEYYPEINYAQIEYLSSVTPHSNLVNPIGYWDTYTHTDYFTDYFASNELYDHTDSTPQDVFKNIDYFDVREYMYIVNSRRSRETESSQFNEIQKKSAESNTLKNVYICSFDHAAASNYFSVIKNSMDDSNNLIEGHILLNISKFDHTKSGESNHFQKTFAKEEDSLIEICDFKNGTRSQLKKSNALKIEHNKQEDLPKDDTLNNESQSSHPNLENSNDSRKSFDRQENLQREVNIPEKENISATNTSQKNLDVFILDNINDFVHTKLYASSDPKKPKDKTEDFLCELNVSTTVSHPEHTQFEISSTKASQDKQTNLLDSFNTENRSDHNELRKSNDCNKPNDEREDFLCKTDNSEIVLHSFDAKFENSIASKTMYDKQKILMENDILDVKNLSVSPKMEDSNDLKKLEDLECEANNSKTISDSYRVKNEDMSIPKTSHGNEKDLLGINILKHINKLNYMILADPSELKESLDQQQELLLKDNLSETQPNYFHIEYENSSIYKTSCYEQKDLLEVHICENINNSYYTSLADPGEPKKCPDKQKELLLETNNFNTESHYFNVESANADITKTSHDEQKSKLEVNSSIELNELEKCFSGHKGTQLEANSFKSKPHHAHIDLENSNALKTLHHRKKDFLEDDILKIESDYNFTNLDSRDLGELNKFFDKQEELLLRADNSKDSTHSGNIEFESCYFSKTSCDDEKNVIKINVSETVQEPHYLAFVDSESEEFSTNKQEDLIGFNSSIKNDDLLNLITFEGVPEDSNNMPTNL